MQDLADENNRTFRAVGLRWQAVLIAQIESEWV